MSGKGGRPALVPRYTALVILTLVVVSGIVGYFVLNQLVPPPVGSSEPPGRATLDSVLLELANVSPSTLNQVGFGAPGATSPHPVNSSTLIFLNGKPEVLYVGAEYCPFCAAERWAMIIALDKFGTFAGIEESQSAPSPEAFPNTPTFTFRNATYASNYISFVSVEQLDRNHTRLQNVTADQTALIKTYDTAGSIPFIDFANKYVLVGSQFSPAVLRAANAATGAPYDSSQIATQLNNASSTFAQSIDAAANRLISAICKIDGGSPTSVCSQSFAQTLGYVRGSPSSSPLMASNVALAEPASVVIGLVRDSRAPVLDHSILSHARPVLRHATG
jgi:hypothetical protein